MVSKDPGATSCKFAHTSGLMQTPMYCAIARWILKSFRSVGMVSLAILSFWWVVIVPYVALMMVTPLNMVGFVDKIFLGLHTNLVAACCSSRRNSLVPMEKESSTCKEIIP